MVYGFFFWYAKIISNTSIRFWSMVKAPNKPVKAKSSYCRYKSVIT
jgi:hypothetical protein